MYDAHDFDLLIMEKTGYYSRPEPTMNAEFLGLVVSDKGHKRDA